MVSIVGSPPQCPCDSMSFIGPFRAQSDSQSGQSPPPDAKTDLAIMERLRRDEEAALADLLGRYWTLLVKYSIGFVGDLDSAEDIVQETFVRVWRSRSTWIPNGSVRAYLFRIARNLALQENEKRGVRVRFGQTEVRRESPATPAEELDRKRLRGALEAAVVSLSPRRQEIVVLARFHDLSYAEIAAVMGISIQTVANQMSSAIRDLRKALK